MFSKLPKTPVVPEPSAGYIELSVESRLSFCFISKDPRIVYDDSQPEELMGCIMDGESAAFTVTTTKISVPVENVQEIMDTLKQHRLVLSVDFCPAAASSSIEPCSESSVFKP